MQQFSRPLAPAKAVFCFLLELNIPEGPEYEKISKVPKVVMDFCISIFFFTQSIFSVDFV